MKGLILYCHSYIQQSRSIYSIYHLIRGKKGIQSLHDARLFHLENIFGIYPRIEKKEFDTILSQLVEQKLLLKTSETEAEYVMTEKAKSWLTLHEKQLYIESYNGLKYTNVDYIFFYRLLLLVQTYTNLKRKNNSFIPVVSDPDIIEWVKKTYKNIKHISPDKILDHLYPEIRTLLTFFSAKEAELIVDHFSGYLFYGMNSNQLAEKYGMDTSDIYLVRTGIIHEMLHHIEENRNDFSCLSILIDQNHKQQFIMNTTLTTFNLLNKGFGPEEIAQMRNLKRNTIYDHIVEIALFEEKFTISDYVSHEEKEEIIKAISQTKSYKLKDIKNNVSERISYFKIRLVLTEEDSLIRKR